MKIVAIDAVDQAQLTYAIMTPDATYMKAGKRTFVVGKLKAYQEEDSGDLGNGYSESGAILYDIDSALKEKDKD